jgi:hypothetical protein
MRAALVATLTVVMTAALAAPCAWGAVAGSNGLLAVQPVSGRGLILVRSDGTGARRICTSRSLCGHPALPRWSPDGRELVFDGSAGGRIGIVDADGSCVACALPSSPSIGRAASAAFRADGQSVSFVAGRGGLWQVGTGHGARPVRLRPGRFLDAVWSAGGQLAAVRGDRILVASTSTGRLRPLARGSSPSWSPDGSRLVFVRGRWVWVVRLSSRVAHRLARGNAPAWSPDGTAVAYVGARDQLYDVSVGGGRPRPIGRVRGRSVDWQPVAPFGCVPPSGAAVLARTPDAVISSRQTDAGTLLYGCSPSVGRNWLLAQGYYLFAKPAAFSGSLAAIEVTPDAKYEFNGTTISVFDLRTGLLTSSGNAGCTDESCTIGPVTLNASGFTAWQVSNSDVTQSLTGVSCPSVSFCIAVDDLGNVLTATAPTGGQNAWTVASIDGTTGFSGVSCPSPVLCVASDSQGDVITSNDPAGGAGAWTAANVDPGHDLTGVSCPSASLCAAVDTQGNVVTSTAPASGAGAWTAASIDPGQDLTGVSCPSASLCVAVDNAGRIITATNPTAGTTAWTSSQIAGTPAGSGPPSFVGVSCPSVSLCVAAGVQLPSSALGFRAVVSNDPTGGATSWTSSPSSPPDQLPSAGVACASASSCVVGSAGGLITSSNPTGTQPVWSRVQLDPTVGSVTALTCPSAVLCVAVDSNGVISTSSNPQGGSGAWTSTAVDQPHCASPNVCRIERLYAHDNHGTRLIDSINQPGPGDSLANLALSANTLTWTHQGMQRTTTLG